ncbi:MAG TPA: endopeptidase La [Polyangiaceae bacterium]|nr:endopeptidase La [Polyangiaceae bacterium]
MLFKPEGEKAGARKQVPALPLRDIILFPHMVSQLFVGREKSIAALDEAMNRDKEIFLSAQKNAKTNDPTPEDIYLVGTLGTIVQLLRLADGTVKVLIEGKRRAKIKRFTETRDVFLVEVEPLADPEGTGNVELEALCRSVQGTFEVYVKLNKKIQPEILMTVQSIDEPGRLSDTIAASLQTLKLVDRQGLLELPEPRQRLERLYELMQAEIEILQVEKKIRSRVKKQMEKTQKEYYLNEQMQAIQKELGGGERDEFKNELAELEEKLRAKQLPEEAQGRMTKELKKLKMMHPTSAEATVVRNYIDWVLALPWFDKTEERYDIPAAERVLDEDHYGLTKVKERIVEYLAVQALTKKLKGPILCFVGPPGVGKTSVARSIARATGRKFVRVSLGGVRDEAEIRGHRRTYIGALPGKIIQNLKRVGSNNPLFLLDEVDKMSSDFRGDPASALLEVLDPEQNHTFNDHYLDLDYDLSDVMFIATANTLAGIPVPLQDRMEIIQLSGYTEYEKLNIAERYLIPRQRTACGLENSDVTITQDAVRFVIHHYTKESGVRSLERELGSICRKVALKVVKNSSREPVKVDAADVAGYLSVPKYRLGKKENRDEIGLTHGLSVSDWGGDILDCEVTVLPGKGKLSITGLLEKGMEESGQAAMSYIRSRAAVLHLETDFYQKNDVHVHFPDFIRKDGPSAGVTMATSIASALCRIPVRHDVAMTGEITLRGRVMPIGGLKEKLLAAHRGGIKTVLVPKENRKDLHDLPKRVLAALRIVLVEHMDDVLREALALDETDHRFGPGRPGLEYKEGEPVSDIEPLPSAADGPDDAAIEQPGV